jgi:uncharacterized protein YcgI (DUF1989 family)
MNEVLIKGGHGGRIEVGEGNILEVINMDGQQICDFFAFNAHDLGEALSPGHIRTVLGRIVLKVGDVLVSRYRKPMFEIVEDTCGRHDIVFPPCDPEVYLQRFGLHDHRSCRTNLAEVMADKQIPYAYLPDPVNFFQNSPVAADGSIQRLPSTARPGDKVVLRALQDMLVAGSACPMIGGMNGDRSTDIRFVVRDG